MRSSSFDLAQVVKLRYRLVRAATPPWVVGGGEPVTPVSRQSPLCHVMNVTFLTSVT